MENVKKQPFIGKMLLAAGGLLVVALVIRYFPAIVKITFSIDEFRNYILSLGKAGPIGFVFFQVLQTVIAPIPGEVVQIAGGYIYGVTLGTLYAMAGLLAGAMIAFYFTRFLGGAYVQKLLSGSKFKWMTAWLNNDKFSVFLFIIFVIPGLPKDMFIYAAALTAIRPMRFFVILLVARFPWILASASIGANLYEKNYMSTIIISAVAVIGFIAGVIYKDKLMDRLSRLQKRTDKS